MSENIYECELHIMDYLLARPTQDRSPQARDCINDFSIKLLELYSLCVNLMCGQVFFTSFNNKPYIILSKTGTNLCKWAWNGPLPYTRKVVATTAATACMLVCHIYCWSKWKWRGRWPSWQGTVSMWPGNFCWYQHIATLVRHSAPLCQIRSSDYWKHTNINKALEYGPWLEQAKWEQHSVRVLFSDCYSISTRESIICKNTSVNQLFYGGIKCSVIP